MNEAQFRNDANVFLQNVFKQIKSNKIVIEKYWNIDHLCFRTESQKEYSETKNYFLQFMDLLIESEVNGRLISTFKLKKAIQFEAWSIDVVELPAPKIGKIVKTGFEHIEIVVDQTFAKLEQQYPHLRFDRNGLNKAFNQELEIELQGLAIKFHHLSLESVINVEKNKDIFAVLTELEIFKKLKSFSPLMSGSRPLNIHLKDSDIDILVGTDRVADLERELELHFGHFSEFSVTKNGRLVCRFKYDGYKFEIYADNQHPVEQVSNRHFLIQERLLKLFGEVLRQKIIELKNSGMKTEPAFAKALGMIGDGYKELLDLRFQSEEELIRSIKFV